MSSSQAFRESNLFGAPIRDLGLAIEGTRLAPVIDEFQAELEQRGITRSRTRGFIFRPNGACRSARSSSAFRSIWPGPELTELHGEEVGHIEGLEPRRHPALPAARDGARRQLRLQALRRRGVGQAVRLDHAAVPEDYRPQPFSRRYVRHLPGWYAQKHPDEDWAETFAVWMTPGRDWRAEYAQRPDGAGQARVLRADDAPRSASRIRRGRRPSSTKTSGSLDYSLEQFYKSYRRRRASRRAGLDGDLRAIFDDLAPTADRTARRDRDAASAGSIRRLERPLMADVFRWTGHFPERTRSLMRHLAQRADALQQVYPRERREPKPSSA